MKHVVMSEHFTCPKCKKTTTGAAVEVLECVVCTDCFYEKYMKELAPKIKEMVRQYFDLP